MSSAVLPPCRQSAFGSSRGPPAAASHCSPRSSSAATWPAWFLLRRDTWLAKTLLAESHCHMTNFILSKGKICRRCQLTCTSSWRCKLAWSAPVGCFHSTCTLCSPGQGYAVFFLCKQCNVVYRDSCVSKVMEQNVLTVTVHWQHAFPALAGHKHENIPHDSQKQQVKICYIKQPVYCGAPRLHWICCTKCSCSFGRLFLHLFVLVQSAVCLLVPEASSADRCCSEGDSCCSTELRPFARVVGQVAGCVTSLPVHCSLEFCSKF